MDRQVNWLREIQTENTHDGLRINDISAGDKIKIKILLADCVYERFNFVDGI